MPRWRLLALLAVVPARATAGSQWFFQRARAARPTDHPDPNRNAYTVPRRRSSPACTRHFCVHWVAVGIDAPSLTDSNGDGVPDYVERVQAVAEHVYSVENGKLGWREPRSPTAQGRRAGQDRHLPDEIGGALFGYAAPDRGQASKAHRLPRQPARIPGARQRLRPLRVPRHHARADLEVTLAHEYNHILQFGYDAYQDPWFAESTAVWMEDQVYNGIDDYLRYVRRWVKRFDTPLTANSIKEYGSAVWNNWLAHRYGRSIVRNAWARAIHTRPGGFSVAAYDSAIQRRRGLRLLPRLRPLRPRPAEWRTGPVFREGPLYPDVSRQGTLPLDGRALRPLAQPHHLPVAAGPREGRAGDRRQARSPRGDSPRGLALVGRIGTERHGQVVSRLRFRQNGGAMTVRLARPGPLQPHHRGAGQRRHQRLGLQCPPARLGLLDRQGAVPGLGRGCCPERPPSAPRARRSISASPPSRSRAKLSRSAIAS